MKKDWRDLAVTPLATQESKCTLYVLVIVLCCLDTPWPGQLLLKKAFNWGAGLQFQRLSTSSSCQGAWWKTGMVLEQ